MQGVRNNWVRSSWMRNEEGARCIWTFRVRDLCRANRVRIPLVGTAVDTPLGRRCSFRCFITLFVYFVYSFSIFFSCSLFIFCMSSFSRRCPHLFRFFVRFVSFSQSCHTSYSTIRIFSFSTLFLLLWLPGIASPFFFLSSKPFGDKVAIVYIILILLLHKRLRSWQFRDIL